MTDKVIQILEPYTELGPLDDLVRRPQPHTSKVYRPDMYEMLKQRTARWESLSDIWSLMLRNTSKITIVVRPYEGKVPFRPIDYDGLPYFGAEFEYDYIDYNMDLEEQEEAYETDFCIDDFEDEEEMKDVKKSPYVTAKLALLGNAMDIVREFVYFSSGRKRYCFSVVSIKLSDGNYWRFEYNHDKLYPDSKMGIKHYRVADYQLTDLSNYEPVLSLSKIEKVYIDLIKHFK